MDIANALIQVEFCEKKAADFIKSVSKFHQLIIILICISVRLFLILKEELLKRMEQNLLIYMLLNLLLVKENI